MFSQIAFLVILILLNAYFAATEIAFISLNDAKIEKKAKEGNKRAKQIQRMLKNPSKFLATIQIGITLAGFLSSAFASDAFADKLAPVLNSAMPFLSIGVWRNISIIIITMILSFFTLVFGELVPKRLAMKYYEKISYATIGVIKAISIVTAPFVKLLTWSTNLISKLFGVGEQEEEIVTEEEIKMMIDQGEEKGVIEETEKEIINNVFALNDIVASEIMMHRTDMFAIEINENIYELLSEIDDYKYSRIPVYEESIDNIKGILYLKDILKLVSTRQEFKIADILKEAYFVPESKPIDEIFKELQTSKMQMAIVVDEYGGTAGLLTMEDILEELVGNIFDEYDEEEFEYKMLDENTYLMEGSISLYEVKKILEIDLPEGDYETLSGYLIEQLGRLPEEQEHPIIEDDKLTYKIEHIEDRRIKWVKVCKNQPEITKKEEEKE
ncbi:MAG: HlyC/CorC family transporter [Clostridia bacterium]|nr:HlyC/CorC family transporter [Clostridia bacterium]